VRVLVEGEGTVERDYGLNREGWLRGASSRYEGALYI